MSLQLKLFVSFNDFFSKLKRELRTIKDKFHQDLSDEFYAERRNILNKISKEELSITAATINSTNEMINTLIGQTISFEQTSELTSHTIIWQMLDQWTWNVLLLEIFGGYELVDFQQYFQKFLQLYFKSRK